MIFPASTNGGGQCMAAPDVCKTPAPPSPSPVPIPYPNIAMLTDANPATCSLSVLMMNKQSCTVMTEMMRTSGDEAGVAGGVVSGMNMGPAKFELGSFTVLVEGNGATYLTGMTGHNGMSANMPAGVQVAPSQVKVLVTP